MSVSVIIEFFNDLTPKLVLVGRSDVSLFQN